MQHPPLDSLKRYQRYFKYLIEHERQEEIALHQREIFAISGEQRQKKGRALLGMTGYDAGTGIGGLYMIRYKRKEALTHTEISIGDLAIVSKGNPSGKEDQAVVLEKTKGYMVLAFQSMPPSYAYGSGLRIDLFANDVTFKRMQEALAALHTQPPLAELLLASRIPEKNDNPSEVEVFKNEKLNESQQAAVRQSLKEEDIFLIHGPPGTGKTTTLIEIIIQHIELGKKILVTADSNTAVDNLLERLLSFDVKVARVGNPARIHPELISATLEQQLQNHEDFHSATSLWTQVHEIRDKQQGFVKPTGKNKRGMSDDKILSAAKKGGGSRGIPANKMNQMAAWLKMQKKIKQLVEEAKNLEKKAAEKILENVDVICTTNSSSGSALLEDFRFSMVCIDEATQSVEPACLIPMVKGRKWILAGDHKQLPPTVLSKEAEALNLSLFERWIEKYPRNSHMLNIQYRMNEQILSFPSKRFYQGQLFAHPSVAKHDLTSLSGYTEIDHLRGDGLQEVLVPQPVISFIDVDGMEDKFRDSYSYFNQEEINMVLSVVRGLMECRLFPQDIGVISPYNKQVALLKEQLDETGVDVKSVDGFQGREKEVIIVSFVRSNEAGDLGFLKDYRRLNVAITRAKRKLILIGNKKTLMQDALYADFIQFIDQPHDINVQG